MTERPSSVIFLDVDGVSMAARRVGWLRLEGFSEGAEGPYWGQGALVVQLRVPALRLIFDRVPQVLHLPTEQEGASCSRQRGSGQ